MRIGAPAPQSTEQASAPPARNGAAAPARFGALLQQHLTEPRDRIEISRNDVRLAIDEIRGGGLLWAGARLASTPAAGTASRPNAAGYAAYTQLAGTRGADPFGWRTTTRRLGDEVAPGFGTIFERQIQQESGFDPDVAFGFRRSSAGAEGIAQLMPQYYPGVDRTDPQASLAAAAETMQHYLTAHDGDVRRALASYNAGLGRVRSLVDAHGAAWERALPAETRSYLEAILGSASPRIETGPNAAEPAVFGGRGPGGVLTWPLDQPLAQHAAGGALSLLGSGGAAVRAPADGTVSAIDRAAGLARIVLAHGNGWETSLGGVSAPELALGDRVRRGDTLGTLPGGPGAALEFAVTLEGRALDPTRYFLGNGSSKRTALGG